MSENAQIEPQPDQTRPLIQDADMFMFMQDKLNIRVTYYGDHDGLMMYPCPGHQDLIYDAELRAVTAHGWLFIWARVSEARNVPLAAFFIRRIKGADR